MAGNNLTTNEDSRDAEMKTRSYVARVYDPLAAEGINEDTILGSSEGPKGAKTSKKARL